MQKVEFKNPLTVLEFIMIETEESMHNFKCAESQVLIAGKIIEWLFLNASDSVISVLLMFTPSGLRT